jgi:AraC-like DNA-binding protein
VTHRHLTTFENRNDHLQLSCPYFVDVDQIAPGVDDHNRLPWSRLYLMDPDGPVGDDSVLDVLLRQRHRLQPGAIVLLPPDRLYGFRFAPGMRMLAYHFRLEWAPGCDVFAHLEHWQTITDGSALVRQAYQVLATEPDSLSAIAQLRGLLLQIAGRFIGEPPVPSTRIRTVLGRIEDDCRADLSLDTLAREQGLRRETLSRQFRSEVGLTLQEHLHRRLIQHAALGLLAGERVKDVAERLGFTSEFYFSRFFKRRTGSAPRDFRQLPT